jgi:CspA family cold shock protein
MKVVELSGHVKWFDHTRGFGFIVTPMGDVLVHRSRIIDHGLRALPEGAQLLVEAFQGKRGLQANKVLSIDLSKAKPAKATQRPHGPAGKFELVEVKWFNGPKGYGFLDRAGEDVFLHAETARAAHIEKLESGSWIEARVAQCTKGLIATEVRHVHEERRAA